ncbi:MAG TPA: ribosomal protein S18-alanine N-acetyltransferase [Casimicrobiaceae bacterium]|nr:ribosomal protein S18-alanine N-acetyltransferase [Casimicrobiaceae bacterium]
MATLPSQPPSARVIWRPLAGDDLAYVAALEAQIHAAPWTLGNFRDALAAGYSTRVAERECRIVAYGILMLAPGEAQILNISVVPDARRQGFGRALLLQFLDDARQFGAEQCFLEVRVSNVAAIMLYEGAGFAPIARRNDYYPPVSPGLAREDALVMRRALKPLWPRSA